jgi:hypothetical protein
VTPLLGERRRFAVLAAALAAAAALALPATGSARVHGLKTGFTDIDAFQNASPEDRALAFQRAHAAGATFVRLAFSWAAIADATPANLADTSDPAWAGYQWTFSDDIIRQAESAGLTPIVEITSAPPWAEGPNRPPVSDSVPAGTWKPSPAAFGDFANAIARRYSGSYPDPANPGQSLPRVVYWQGWNEPNLSLYLNPQWVRASRGFRAESPALYRPLLNAWYRGVKGVSSRNVVITGGTSPFGDLKPGGTRMPPALFYRELFCLRGRKALRHVHCANSPVRFDVLAHHPYPIGPPRRHAPNPDDVVIADFSRLTRPLKVALKDGTVAPRRHKQVWATEFSWESNPPDPAGIPAGLEATYLEGALSELWSEGVTVAGWYNMRDDPVGAGYQFTLQSGVYMRAPSIQDDTPKPSYTAFSFPFTAYVHHGRVQLWGLAPSTGLVTVEAQHGSGWRTVARLHARSGDRLFLGTARVKAKTVLRARQGTQTSLTWTVFSPR